MKTAKLWVATVLITVATNVLCIAQNIDASKAASGYVITDTDSIVGQVAINFEDNSVLVKTKTDYYNFHADHVLQVIKFTGENNKGFTAYYAYYFGRQPS